RPENWNRRPHSVRLATMQKLFTPTVKRWLLISAGLHLVAAVFSLGFYHTDEHFQILEFLNYLLGLSPASDLPIEFHRQIRSWMQPGIYFVLLKALSVVGVKNPFFWALAIRLFS